MKQLPFTQEQIEQIMAKYPTPFYLYDEEGIRNSARKLIDAFKWSPGFKQFFAVKATPNPTILEILKQEGCGADCSSLPELVLAERAKIVGEDIILTSNDTPADEFKKARELNALINLDDLTHLSFLQKNASLPDLISFRYNPGAISGGNDLIGDPKGAKYGVTKEQLFEGYSQAQKLGIKRFGLHTMVVSNELDPQHIINTAKMIFDVAVEVQDKLNIKFEFINLGGGLGIPYKPEEKELDLEYVSSQIQALYEERNLAPTKLFTESGRYITGPHGYLISKVRHIKDTYKKYVGLDASMADLMRPGMYGAYHHITVLGKENPPADATELETYDITGSLCENNDKFAINRQLPKIEVGDTIVIHDAGAHGHAMGFNYNGKLRPAELLLKKDGSVKLIRRAETMDDYFATLNI